MSKYIIKNCPCFDKDNTQCLDTPVLPITEMILCKDHTDCVLKQIVELCKNKDYFVKRFPNAQFSSGVQNSELAFDILQLLNIQESEG